VTVNSVTYTDPTHITLNLTLAVNAAAGLRSITVTNPDGQSISSASGILTITPTAPAAPDLQTASDAGTSSTDNITNVTNPTFDVAAVQAGATVDLLRDGVVVATTTNAAAGTVTLQDPGPAAAGSRSYTTRQTVSGVISAASTALVVTIDTTAPQLVGTPGFQFNVAPQSISYAFSEDVGASLTPHDFLVEQLPTGGATVADADKSVSGTSSIVLGFTSVLASGNYRVTIAASDVTDTAGNALSAGSTFDFFIYAGDVNHDRWVDVGDLGLLATNYGTSSGATWGQGDFNYDGAVDVADLGQLAGNYGTTLAQPTGSAVTAASAMMASPAAAPADPFWKHTGNLWGDLPIKAAPEPLGRIAECKGCMKSI
ncbi:MAG TPA: Ig-like domain-containing protein, partial [Tepidisphaeraceae bacterium]|nr:Ig-like domain-containing protein [Tepidisphaeraceae bacterium]